MADISKILPTRQPKNPPLFQPAEAAAYKAGIEQIDKLKRQILNMNYEEKNAQNTLKFLQNYSNDRKYFHVLGGFIHSINHNDICTQLEKRITNIKKGNTAIENKTDSIQYQIDLLIERATKRSNPEDTE